MIASTWSAGSRPADSETTWARAFLMRSCISVPSGVASTCQARRSAGSGVRTISSAEVSAPITRDSMVGLSPSSSARWPGPAGPGPRSGPARTPGWG